MPTNTTPTISTTAAARAARALAIKVGGSAYRAAVKRLDNREAVYALEAIATAQAGLDVLARQAVAMARADRETWETIGNALGVTKQAAQQRFGHLNAPR